MSVKFRKVNELTIIVNCNIHTLIYSRTWPLHSMLPSLNLAINNSGGLYECCVSGPTYSRCTVMNLDCNSFDLCTVFPTRGDIAVVKGFFV